MESNFFNSEETVASFTKLFKDNLIFLLHDCIKFKTNKQIATLVSRFVGDIIKISPLKIFVFNYTFKNPIQEYIKGLTQIPPELFFRDIINDLIYYKNTEIQGSVGYGIILDVPSITDINYYDHFKYFKIHNEKIEKVEISKEYKKTLFKTNTTNKYTKNNELYNTKMLIISSNIEITENLLQEIYLTYNIDLEKLMFESKNEEPIYPALEQEQLIMHAKPIEDKIVFNNICIPLYNTYEENLEYYTTILNNAFANIDSYLKFDFMNYITNDKNIIRKLENINIEFNESKSIYYINTNDEYIKLIIKILAQSNGYYNTYHSDFLVFNNEHPSLDELLSLTNLEDLLEIEKKKLFKDFKDYLKLVHEKFSINLK